MRSTLGVYQYHAVKSRKPGPCTYFVQPDEKAEASHRPSQYTLSLRGDGVAPVLATCESESPRRGAGAEIAYGRSRSASPSRALPRGV